jgi:hypothetical protein
MARGHPDLTRRRRLWTAGWHKVNRRVRSGRGRPATGEAHETGLTNREGLTTNGEPREPEQPGLPTMADRASLGRHRVAHSRPWAANRERPASRPDCLRGWRARRDRGRKALKSHRDCADIATCGGMMLPQAVRRLAAVRPRQHRPGPLYVRTMSNTRISPRWDAPGILAQPLDPRPDTNSEL